MTLFLIIYRMLNTVGFEFAQTLSTFGCGLNALVYIHACMHLHIYVYIYIYIVGLLLPFLFGGQNLVCIVAQVTQWFLRDLADDN